MQSKLPPLKNLRKTTVLVLVVFLGFLVHRVVVLCSSDNIELDSYDTELSVAKSVVCSHIVNGSPFGVDSVFEEGSRIYYYSTVLQMSVLGNDSIFQIWFYGLDTIQKHKCDLNKDVCYSSMSPDSLKVGEWSVDFVAGRRLLSTKQFIVEPSDR